VRFGFSDEWEWLAELFDMGFLQMDDKGSICSPPLLVYRNARYTQSSDGCLKCFLRVAQQDTIAKELSHLYDGEVLVIGHPACTFPNNEPPFQDVKIRKIGDTP
jgi:hypothetical protein